MAKLSDDDRMDFVPWNHPGVEAAFERNKQLPPAAISNTGGSDAGK